MLSTTVEVVRRVADQLRAGVALVAGLALARVLDRVVVEVQVRRRRARLRAIWSRSMIGANRSHVPAASPSLSAEAKLRTQSPATLQANCAGATARRIAPRPTNAEDAERRQVVGAEHLERLRRRPGRAASASTATERRLERRGELRDALEHRRRAGR